MNRNRLFQIFILVSFLATLPFLLSAVGNGQESGGDIIFNDTKKFAPVLFSHAGHLKTGSQCEDCHDGIFQKKAGSADIDNALTMKALKQGKFCGTCHDGEKAFSVRGSCKKCHVKTPVQKGTREGSGG